MFALTVAPRLESWDRADHPSQLALAEYLKHVDDLVGKQVREASTPLALLLSIGLPTGTDLLAGGRDLDNYLHPVVRSLNWDRFASVHGEKRHGESWIRVGPAREASLNSKEEWSFASAQTTVSSQSVAWKQQVADQIGRQVPRPAASGPLEVHLSLRLSARRNWAYVWKPALDSLGAIFGQDPGGKLFHPQDDRVIRLGLHRVIDNDIANRIELGVWWKPLSVPGPRLSPRFEEALVYVARLHANQTRKGTDIPYVSHLIAVAGHVIEDGGDEDEAIAALLHDAVEDQGGSVQLERIRTTFGDRVASIVESCSDSFEDPKPPWEDRKQAYVQRLTTEEDEGILRVSLADKLHNARAILRDLREIGGDVWKKFNAPPNRQLWYYRSLIEIFRARLKSPMLFELEEIVRKLEQLVPRT